jgi:hypothetical protein
MNMKKITIEYANQSFELAIGIGNEEPQTIADDIIIKAINGEVGDYYFCANGALTWHLRTAKGRISKILNTAIGTPVRVEGYAYKSYCAGGYMRRAWVLA